VEGGPNPSSREPRLWLILSVIGVMAVVIGFVALVTDGPSPSTTTSSTVATSTTGSSTTTTLETSSTSTTATTSTSSTTTVTQPGQTEYDVIVVGDGLGGATAATVAARLGADTLLLSPIGYLGGQAGAAGVSTMDEGGNRYVLRRAGVYKELVNHAQFKYGINNVGDCYFIDDPLCPEPLAIDEFFRNTLGEVGVDVVPVREINGVVQEGNRVTGVVVDDIEYRAAVVIDATEFSDLYPLIDGLEYEVGDPAGCVQDTTWLAIRSWYPGGAPTNLVPPQDAIAQLYAVYGPESDRWLDHFRGEVVNLGQPVGAGPTVLPWDIATETAYRALADSRSDITALPDAPTITKTGVNYANDSALTVAAIDDPVAREQEFRKALHITYAYLWYLRWELGVTDWGVSNDMGFSKGTRLLEDDLIPDEIEINLPPFPYVREGRRLVATYNLGAADLADTVREHHRFDDAVMLGGYFTDFHGCPPTDEVSGYGLFEVPIGVFIPARIDGFLPGIARAAGVSRVGSAAVRTQPEEMWGGQVAGTIAGLAVANDILPRDVPTADVQNELRASGLVFFLPG
jgi:FAD-dependent oxidoreductase family protein